MMVYVDNLMRSRIFAFLIGALLIGGLVLIFLSTNEVSARIVDSWEYTLDPRTTADTLEGIKLGQDGKLYYDDEGDGIDSNDTIVDENVRVTEDIWKIQVTVDTYRVYLKREAIGIGNLQSLINRNVSGYDPDKVGWAICNEVNPPNSAYYTVKEKSTQIVLQSIIPDKDVLIGLAVCVKVDIIEMPNVTVSKIIVNDYKVKMDTEGDIPVTTIPAGYNDSVKIGFKLVYFKDTWRVHEVSEKVRISVKWYVEDKMDLTVPPELCMYLDTLPDQVRERRQQFCNTLLESGRSIVLYGIDSVSITKV